jgi:hypothetical protein
MYMIPPNQSWRTRNDRIRRAAALQECPVPKARQDDCATSGPNEMAGTITHCCNVLRPSIASGPHRVDPTLTILRCLASCGFTGEELEGDRYNQHPAPPLGSLPVLRIFIHCGRASALDSRHFHQTHDSKAEHHINSCIFGNETSAWTSRNKPCWPHMLAKDGSFNAFRPLNRETRMTRLPRSPAAAAFRADPARTDCSADMDNAQWRWL